MFLVIRCIILKLSLHVDTQAPPQLFQPIVVLRDLFGFSCRPSVWSPRTVCLDFEKALSSFRVNVHHNCCLADNY